MFIPTNLGWVNSAVVVILANQHGLQHWLRSFEWPDSAWSVVSPAAGEKERPDWVQPGLSCQKELDRCSSVITADLTQTSEGVSRDDVSI